MTINELLNELSEQGVKLWTDGEKLHIRANKGVITPEKQELISEHKAEILEQLRKNKIGSSTTSLPVIVPQPEKRYEPFPMTDMQYAFWVGRMGVLELSDVANHGYYEIEAVGLNIERLNQALNQLIQRHDMLRAVMLAEGLQQVLEKVPMYEISTLDLRGEDEDLAWAKISEIRDIMSHQVLPVEKWPLFEFRATIWEQQRLRLHFSYDLQIFDGWSVMRLFEEWFEVYHHRESILKPLEITFRDYVLAEQAIEKTELYERSRQYWLNRIDSLPPAPDLPLAIHPSSIKDYQCQRFSGKLDKTTWQKLKKRAGEAGLTPSSVLLTAFADVLTFWGKSPQFTMNLALFNRLPLHPQVNNILGDFTSVTLLGVDNSGTETFTKRALRLQRQLWQDLEHRYFSGVRVMREINSRQGQTPTAMPVVFTSSIGFDSLDGESSNLFKFGELVYAISQASQVWLDHQVGLQNGELIFTWDAVAALFPEGMISDMFDAYYSLIRNLANSDVAWGETTRQGMMPENQLRARKNVNATEKPIVDGTLYGLFAKQVQVRGNEVAVIASSRSLNYHDLSELSRQLGGKLQQLGAAPNQLVAVVMEKGWEQVVGVLGVLAAGAAYVPINPKEPKERLQYLLSNSEAEIVLTQSWLTDIALPENIKRIDVDTFSPSPTENFPSPVTAHPDDLAYLIYTSGSTGLPKGVMITHQKAVNTMTYTNQRFSVGVNDRMLAVTALNHDMSVYDIFGLLSAGGTIIMPDAARVKDPYHWIELINSKQVTMWNSVPQMMEMLVESALSSKESLPSSFRIAFWGGDWISLSLPKRLRTLVNDIEIISVGGPTETTVWNICYPIKEVEPNWKSIPYGQPMANSKYYVLNENLEDCPMWVPGQMYSAGLQIAKGYWRNEEKTNASFIIHPRTGERIYGTGDLGRYLPDGNIEFIGRVDFQVKIRGHRVETGEIEAALTKHSGVKSAVVKEFGKDEKQRLVAYIIPSQKPEPSIAEINQFLQDKLPEYMIPSAYIFLEKFPLSANGKIDRRSLQRPEGNFSTIETNYVAPQTKIEKAIVEIWQEVLELEKVGINDNFFGLGGHSLLATKLISRLRVALDVEIPLTELFSSPTVAQLESTITQLRNSNDEKPSQITLPTIIPTPEEKTQPFPLTDIQQAYWLGRNQNFDLGNIATHTYTEIDCSNLNLPQFNQAWQKVIEHHDMLRVVVLADGQQQILEQVPTYSIEVLDLSSCSKSEISEQLETIREQMSHEILPAEQWPLFKIRATILDEQQTRIHLSFDAIIGDAWSMISVLQQWQQIYKNPQTLLPPLEISFRDYVVTELSLKNTPKYQRAQEYWFNRNLPPAPELPFAIHPSSISQPTFKRHNAQLEPQQWQKLKQLATKANLTPSGVLLTAFADILNYWSKSPNFTINLTLFNRFPLHPQVNQLVGDFTSLTLLEVDNSNITSFTTRAQRLQKQLWQDLDHNYVSGIEVQRQLRRVRGNTQSMGVVFTSTLGTNLMEDTSSELFGEVVYAISQTPQVWLDHQIVEEDGALVFNWDVVEELFPDSLIEDMFASYCNWLEQLANTEDAWLETHPQLLPAKQLSSIVAVNNTDTSIVEETLHSLFHKQVTARSQFPAVITPKKTLTYEQLHQKASNLAQQLRQLGATPNTLVAVIMEKGWEQIVAVLGILISGAAYLPISADFPQERQQYLLELGQVKLAITQPQLEPNLSLPEGIECLVVTEEELQSAPSNQLESIQKPDDLAYVIYTSGSTGKPKGVMIDHKGAVNTILDINKRFGVGVDDRVLAVSALEFDLSVYDIFGILAAGGAIVMPEGAEYQRKDPAHWLELINAHQVTIWNTVPALMQMLVEHLSVRRNEQVGNLRLVLLSGDWLPVNLPEQVKSLYSDIEVISLGGATEASIWSIFYPIDKVESKWNSIPYGKPLDNQRFYVLNKLMQPTPTWVEGELYIGGIGLAKGYWQDEAKTNNSFITHSITQERLYKTGDLGRYLPSGDIEFLGREDFQVKINGFRIELGEIEVALKEHSAVKEAVVSSHNNQLVGYVVSSPDTLSDICEILNIEQQFVQQRWQSFVDLQNQQAQKDEDIDIEDFSMFWDNLEQLYIDSVCIAFSQLGVYSQPGEKYNLEQLISQCRIVPRYRKWLYRALKNLAQKGWLKEEGEIFESISELPSPQIDFSSIRAQFSKHLNLTEKESDWAIQSAVNLRDIITENVHSAQIYAAEETPQIYQTIFSSCHEIGKEVIKTIVKSTPPGKPLRILEVGAGYGSMTSHLLPLLPETQTTYVFTDISHFFLQKAQENFSVYPFLKYDLLDLTVNPTVQGYDLHSFDIIIAASVLHDTSDLEKSMKYLRSLLVPSGLILFLEETKFHPSFDLGMGIQQGFDVFEDKSLRSEHPLLSRNQWQDLLANLGFESSLVLNQPGSICELVGFDIFIAQGPPSVNKFQPDRLYQYLAGKLPEYMLPSNYILLENLPLTPNGKVDRNALELPKTRQLQREKTFVAPRNVVEEQLALIWTEIIGVTQIGIYDDFFSLGGDSLVATRVISKIRETFQVEFPLANFFEAPTVKNVAEYLEVAHQVLQVPENIEEVDREKGEI